MGTTVSSGWRIVIEDSSGPALDGTLDSTVEGFGFGGATMGTTGPTGCGTAVEDKAALEEATCEGAGAAVCAVETAVAPGAKAVCVIVGPGILCVTSSGPKRDSATVTVSFAPPISTVLVTSHGPK
jgi:hypothetical protein